MSALFGKQAEQLAGELPPCVRVFEWREPLVDASSRRLLVHLSQGHVDGGGT
jgi:hypothetical protein